MKTLIQIGMLFITTIGLTACGPELNAIGSGEGDEGPQPATSSLPLYYRSTALWPKRDIPVCFEFTGLTTEKLWIHDALRGQRSWARTADIDFVGFGTCVEGSGGIRIRSGDSMRSNVGYFGSSNPTSMTLDFGSNVEGRYSRCDENNLDREQCIKAVALHEFGHALGYSHEHNRDDTPASCTDDSQRSSGDTTYGLWDGESIMAYCDFTTDLSPTDRLGTGSVYGRYHGDPPKLRDFNGDGRSDLLCQNPTSATKQVDFADASGAFRGSDWNQVSGYCNTHNGRLFKGDFNGDGRTDLLCHHLVTGNKGIDYADASGRFGSGDWSRMTTWCSYGEGRIHVGDFNGDGRDDLLCHESDTGKRYVDYADTAGQLKGTDWSQTTPDTAWCDESKSQVLVGDFNGDGRADLLCDGTSKEIDYADASGQFGKTDWSRNASWCREFDAQLLTGDFNTDGRFDMLCHRGDGTKWIDYADSSGRFGGTDWSTSVTFCSQNAGRLYVGDVNGDGRDDLVCHDVRTGDKLFDYADASGRFNGSDWEAPTPWCGETGAELL